MSATNKPARKLVSEAYEKMRELYESDGEITNADIRSVHDLLEEASQMEPSDFTVTLYAEGPKNQLNHHLYPEGRYEYPPFDEPEETIEGILTHEVDITIQ